MTSSITQCESKIHLLFHSHNTTISLYKTDAEHTNDTINESNKKQSIPDESEKLIEAFIKRGQSTAMQIADLLEQEKINDPSIVIPTYRQINNYKNNRKEREVPSIFNFAQLSNILQSRNKQPDEYDEPFVIDYQIKVDDDDEVEGATIKKEQFRFAISTVNLLTLLSTHCKTLQVDSTYNLIWNNNPVMIAGISDNENQFHPIILAVCTDETKDDYQFMFDSLIKGVDDLGNF